MEKIIEKLKSQIDFSIELGEDPNLSSWNYEEGILLSRNEAQKILAKISQPVEALVKPVACVHCEHHFISNTTKKDCCIEFGKPFDQIFSESLFTTENFSCNRFESKPSV